MNELDKVVKKKFSRSDGPFVKNLDKVLSSFHVERQAYYGGTFVGNHVHSCLKVHISLMKFVFTWIFVSDKPYQHCPSLATQARQIADKHRQALLLFSACHNIYVQNYVDTSVVDQLGKQGNYCLSYTYTCSFTAYHLQLKTSNPSWDTIGLSSLLPL